ncbi:MAG: AMP-binding protein [Deltaproteobacteria bacterium]|nr:AMP-binding protein [Deltaproteobacteria bacterium]
MIKLTPGRPVGTHVTGVLVEARSPSNPTHRTLRDALISGGASRPWVVFHKGVEQLAYTPFDIVTLASAWSTALEKAGVRPGDRVLVMLPNEASFLGAFFGASFLGAVPVPTPWPFSMRTLDEVRAQLRPLIHVAAPTALVTSARYAGVAALPTVVEPIESPRISIVGPTKPEAPAFIQFTSGTTSNPRGAVISENAAAESAFLMGEKLGLGPADIGVSWLPFFHDMGLVGALFCSLVRRFTLHVSSPAEFLFRPRRWLELVSLSRATITVGPNFAYELVARRAEPEGLDLSSLRMALSGSEPVLRSTIDAFESRFAPSGIRRGTIVPVYGLAESTLGVCFADRDSFRPDLTRPGRAPIPSVGTPLANTDVELRDANGRPAPEGTEGEICVRGPTVMSGYFGDKEATHRTIRDGWLHTGDLGTSSNGQLYVTGREKDVVIKAGRKYHAEELELCVRNLFNGQSTGVAVFGIPNSAKGTEDLAVAVELKRRDESYEDLVRSTLLTALDVRADVIRFVAPGALPRTTSGKIRRRACLEALDEASLA